MRRFNIWLDNELIDTVKTAAKAGGVKASTYMRMAVVEKLFRDPNVGEVRKPRNTSKVHQVRENEDDC